MKYGSLPLVRRKTAKKPITCIPIQVIQFVKNFIEVQVMECSSQITQFYFKIY